jgi:hypothetical protein
MVVGVPRPPPTCPTITIDVGTVFAVELPRGVNERLLVRLICKPPVAPVGTVINTGDHVEPDVDTELTFSGAHVADPTTEVQK